jgi:hypothetical protein
VSGFATEPDGNGVAITRYAVVIPATIGGKSVTSIGEAVFSGCRNLAASSLIPLKGQDK